IAKKKQLIERFHGFDGAFETPEPSRDDEPGAHGERSGSPVAADIDGVSRGELFPTAANRVHRVIGCGRQDPVRDRSRGVDGYVRRKGDTQGDFVTGGVQRLHRAKDALVLPAEQLALVTGVDLGTERHAYMRGDRRAAVAKGFYT